MILVTAAIIHKEGLVLAARKKPGLPMAGYWEFPGGKIEPGESPRDCLQREIFEELGLHCSVGEYIGESVYDYGNKKVKLLAYHVQTQDTQMQLKDHDAIRWLSVSELFSVDWAPADIALVELLEQQIIREQVRHYYNTNAIHYRQRTLHADVTDQLETFTALLPERARILDVGCGSGRDSRYFLDKGYRVSATDPSEQMARQAATYLGIAVQTREAIEIAEKNYYDGIWACASLIHVPASRLSQNLETLAASLTGEGKLYMSFKYGTSSGWDSEGRYINAMDEQRIHALLDSMHNLKILQIWTSASALAGSSDTWLNILCLKAAD